MSIGIGPIESAPQAQFEPLRAGAPTGPPADAHLPPLVADRLELSSTPPPVAAEKVDSAFSRAIELAAHNRELHFARNDEGDVFVQVRDLDGNVIRTIPNSEVFEVLADTEL